MLAEGLKVTLLVLVWFGRSLCRVVMSSPFLFPKDIFCAGGLSPSCFDGVNLEASFSFNRGDCSCLVL